MLRFYLSNRSDLNEVVTRNGSAHPRLVPFVARRGTLYMDGALGAFIPRPPNGPHRYTIKVACFPTKHLALVQASVVKHNTYEPIVSELPNESQVPLRATQPGWHTFPSHKQLALVQAASVVLHHRVSVLLRIDCT